MHRAQSGGVDRIHQQRQVLTASACAHLFTVRTRVQAGANQQRTHGEQSGNCPRWALRIRRPLIRDRTADLDSEMESRNGMPSSVRGQTRELSTARSEIRKPVRAGPDLSQPLLRYAIAMREGAGR